MQDDELLEYTIPHLQRMFPDFKRSYIIDYHVWRAFYSQPVVERQYSALIPAEESILPGLFLATMAQIYPEDRYNYAIAQGENSQLIQ
jgi:protoporphyrinogen oxidase